MTELDTTQILFQAYSEGRLSARYDYAQQLGDIDLYLDDLHIASFPMRSILGPNDTASVYLPGCAHRPAVSVYAPR